MSSYSIPKSTIAACTGVFLFLALLSRPGAVSASAGNTDCLMCHSAKTMRKAAGLESTSLYVDPDAFGSSAHGAKECIYCHTDLKDQPLKHKAKLAPVDCAKCHEQKGWNPNTIHYAISGSLSPPNCQTCHGSHYIKAKSDPSSEINPANADAICMKCHNESAVLKPYSRGVHSEMGDNGHPAAGCVDCHQPHSGQPAAAPMACAQCHVREYREYAHSAHGKAFLSGNTDVPTCVKCHGAHDILPRDDPRSPVYPTNIAGTCSECHENAKMMRAYNLPADRLTTYRDSYHGVANKYGDLTVATCSSCHEAHDVIPSSDAASSTSARNLPRTCGTCHAGMSKKVALGKTHVIITHHNRDVLYWVSFGFKWLTVGTMMALVGHIMLDLCAQVRGRRRLRRRLR